MSNLTAQTISEEQQELQPAVQQTWHRILLLAMIGYEGAGCLAGGSLLIVAPDGRLMDMPVSIMHGAFSDFLIPGIILFGLGILNTLAFVIVLRKGQSDWFMASLALGAMFVWFEVEILILQDLHWLHLMWGFPVFLGIGVVIPLIVSRHQTAGTRKALLMCGILSSLWYLVINIIVPMQNAKYSVVTQTVSELSALGAPTRIMWALLAILYPMLLMAFGWGVWLVARTRSLRWVGRIILFYCTFNFYWPPMHQREVIAAGGGTITDILHIVWAMVTLLLMMLLMGFGTAGSGRAFRIFTMVNFAVFIVFGILIGAEAPGIDHGLPTPMIGIWERINIGAFMLWVVVFAGTLLRKEEQDRTGRQVPS